MGLRDRIGVDIGRKLKLEDAIEWAAAHDVRWIDIQLDTGANALTSFDDARAAGVRRACQHHGVHLGLHTASAVNVAEYAPHVGEAVDRYLEAYVEVAPRLGAEWIVVHAGYHFTSDKEMRMLAGRERLQRIVGHAERHGALVLLENLNKEPDEAEIHYLAHTVEEWRYYFEEIHSSAFKLSFTVNHAHLVPHGVAGFVDALDMARVEEVRLADCWRNGYEVHLKPGAGDLDFADMFERVESKGFTGHYMNAFGSLDDMLAGREDLVRLASKAGIADGPFHGGAQTMRDKLPCEFPAGYDSTPVLERLARVLDPELDESVMDLGFIRSVQLRSGHAEVAVQLPTSWCAVNFAYLMAEDIRHALLTVDGIREVTVRLGDHCAAAEIEAAVNDGRPFAEAFPGEGAGSLAALRRTFLHKGFLGRQERLLRELREAGCSPAVICALRLGEVSTQDKAIVIRQPGFAPVAGGSAATLQRYLERRAELALDCSLTAPLIIDIEGAPLSETRLHAHYEAARTVRVAMEANGSFCRAMLSLHRVDAPTASAHANTGRRHVQT